MTNHSHPFFAPPITRRQFLKQTAAFSAAATIMPGLFFGQDRPSAPEPDSRATHMLMLGDWGTHNYPAQQAQVSRSMQQWVKETNSRPQALMMLGDNWYGELRGGVDSERWNLQFEQMYPQLVFPGPVYAVLGNHDYERLGGDKVAAQLSYGSSRPTRWHMPSRWYSFSFPVHNPLVTFICLDSNLPGTKPFGLWPFSFVMKKNEQKEQDEWLRNELAKPRSTQFLALIAHHPLYTNGVHGDNHVLIKEWDHLLRDHKVDFYITGHDHDLQHLEFAGHPTSFVISGGGGAELVGWSTPPEKRGPWGARALGFTDMELSATGITMRHIGLNAQELYAFHKDVNGRVHVLNT